LPREDKLNCIKVFKMTDDPAKPFSAKFPNAKSNKEQVEAITGKLNEK
jgi:hypothetical protein